MKRASETISGDELFWGVLEFDHGTEPGGVLLREAALLDERFAELVPVPLETVKPSYVAIDRSRVLAVAALRERIGAIVGSETVALRPDGTPAEVGLDDAARRMASRANFLWGDLEPRPVVRARRRLMLLALGTVTLIAALAVLGVERRASALRTAAKEQIAASEARLRELYPKAGTATAALTLLDRDLVRLTRTRTGRAVTAAQTDAADAVAGLLAAWPRGPEAPKLRTESLTATSRSLSLNVALEDRAGTSVLADGLRTMEGWQLFQPQFTASPQAPGGTLSLSMAADAGPKEARP